MSHQDHTTPSRKKNPVIINETVFCDTETDFRITELYYSRLIACIESVKNQEIHIPHLLVHVIYVSEEKKTYISKLEAIAKQISTDNFKLIIVTYAHPEEGYPFPAGSHIDFIKMPNRSPGYRDRLFQKTVSRLSEQFEIEDFEYFIRIALDDDDFWAPWHVNEVIHIAEHKLTSAPAKLFAIGLVDGFIAHVGEDIARLTTVKFNRCINGNKFVVSRDLNRILNISPWSINDWLDAGTKRDFRNNHEGELALMETGVPSFCYFRRGYNLSQQNKDWCIEKKLEELTFSGEPELIAAIPSLSKDYSHRDIKEVLNAEKLKLSVRLLEKKLKFSTNFDSLRSPGDLISYYLLKDGNRVASLSYSASRNQDEFPLVHGSGSYRVKAFLKRAGTIIETVASTPITF